MTNEVIEGNEWAAYGALDTYSQDETRDRLLKRLLADTCELCKSTYQVEVHHIRKLADLQKPGRVDKPLWVRVMAARRRKTLVVCRECHQAIHAGRPTRKPPGQQ